MPGDFLEHPGQEPSPALRCRRPKVLVFSTDPGDHCSVNKLLLGLALVTLALSPLLIFADVGPPAHLSVSEIRPGVYQVQWRVPKQLPPRAVPSPVLPEACQPTNERSVADQAGAWLLSQEWTCSSTIAGQELGMRYPFRDLALTTVIRVDLLSGDRFAHVLTQDETSWRLPEGTAAPDLIRGAQEAVLVGAGHVVGSWIHAAFLLTLALLGSQLIAIRLVTAFTLGQVATLILGSLTGLGIGQIPAEIALAIGVALLAREGLGSTPDLTRSTSLTAVLGAVHGLTIIPSLLAGVGESGGFTAGLLAILGMDATHLIGALAIGAALAWLSRRAQLSKVRRSLAYGSGAAGMAVAFALALGGGVTEIGAAGSPLIPDLAPGSRPAGQSGRVAPTTPNAPIQSFLSVEPFEIRHEVMVRIAGLAPDLGLEPSATISIDQQTALTERLVQLVLSGTTVLVDGEPVEPLVRRSDFMTVDPTGSLPRSTPVAEPVVDAVVGVIIAYPTEGMSQSVTLAWDPFPTGMMIPATVIDPETVASLPLTAEQPTITWTNMLTEDPVPTVAAVEVEPLRVPIPIVSLPLFVLSLGLIVATFRGWRPGTALTLARMVLALAFVAGPLVQTAVALPGTSGRRPSERQARRILSGLLPNIYRALEFRDEERIYDRLSVSVTGETLTDIYLEQRRALELEERGGAQARVEAVEVLEAGDITSGDTGFDVRAVWTVGGMVTHFGHRHFRQNRYDATIGIVPVDGTWKIQTIEVLEEERVQ